jgi:hypothetical protein
MTLLGLQQAWAYTIFEFQVANSPFSYNNITYTIIDHASNDTYMWYEGDEKYSQLSGARDAMHDDDILDLEADLDTAYTFATFFAIDRTLEPGTPLTMCVKDLMHVPVAALTTMVGVRMIESKVPEVLRY